MATSRIKVPFSFRLLITVITVNGFQQQPPCSFNRLCNCLKPDADAGTITCINVPLPVPPNFSRTFMNELRMTNNSLMMFEESFLKQTGLQKLQIRNNLVTSIPAAAFSGLERTLMQLDLGNNRLYAIPSQAISNLSKLKHLDLSGNYILELHKMDFRGLESALQSLKLRNNDLTEIQQDVFGDLTSLESLDLSGNRLSVIYTNSIRSGPPKLNFLDLSDNVLEALPYVAIRSLKSLLTVNLSRNYITVINGYVDDDFSGTSTMQSLAPNNHSNVIHLQELILDENYIVELRRQAFRHFASLGILSLNRNPLKSITDDAFLGTQITQLYIRNCDLLHISSTVFQHLADRLQLLDLSHNRISDRNTVRQLLTNMSALVSVSLVGNNIGQTLPRGSLNSSWSSLQYLHLEAAQWAGSSKTGISSSDLKELNQQRSLGMSRFPKSTLEGDEFLGVSTTLERLVLTGSNLVELKSDSFQHVSHVKQMDLSMNKIARMEENTFRPMGYSLENLDLGNALDSTLTRLPNRIFKHLRRLVKLDLSNNRLQIIPIDLFHSLSELRYLNLQDNAIRTIDAETIQSDHHEKLESLKMSFNRLTRLGSYTFSKLQSLRYLYLDDNVIETIEPNAFVDLPSLRYLDLQGNRIETIGMLSFHNLPQLMLINLSYNSLKTLSLGVFQHVGDTTILKVDVSHNHLANLSYNGTRSFSTYAYIKIMDFSHNNISHIDPDYLGSVNRFLTELDLSHNKLKHLTKALFEDTYFLTTLKLDHNRIERIDLNSFDSMTSLKVLDLSHNDIRVLQREFFSSNPSLHHLDLSHNTLEDLPDGLFDSLRDLQHLSVASNKLTRFPISTLDPLALSLRQLDLSHNQIRYIPNNSMRPYIHLGWLDLSYNRLSTIEDATFKQWTPNIRYLNLADNPFENPTKVFSSEMKSETLEEINLSNTGLRTFPELDSSNLLHLNVSRNEVGTLEKNALINVTKLRVLDLSYNNLTSVPPQDFWRTLSKLRSLNLAGNVIHVIVNDSFAGLHALNELHVHHLPLHTFQRSALWPLKNLRILETNIYNSMSSGPLDIVRVISPCTNLKTLRLHFEDERGRVSNFDLKYSVSGYTLLPKLNDVTLTGKQFHRFGRGALTAIKSRHLKLTLYNTSVESISSDTFQTMHFLQYLQLDIAENSLITMANPISTEIPGAKGVFLQKLNPKGNRWKCDCYIGWIESWMRNLRQKHCQSYDTPSDHQICQREIQPLRHTICTDMGNKSLIDVLKDDIECEWKSSSSVKHTLLPINVLLLVPLIMMYEL